jgi:hypothetical protein
VLRPVAILTRPLAGFTAGADIHWGTLLSDGTVVDISPGNAGRRAPRTTFDPFGVATEYPIPAEYSVDATARLHAWLQSPTRALYDGFKNNCQQLATWIAFGEPYSPTLQVVVGVAGTLAVVSLVAIAVSPKSRRR